MIEKLYSDFDPDIVVRSAQGKTFDQGLVDLEQLKAIEGVENLSRATEEIVVIKHEKKWVNATMAGVDASFLKISRMKNHMVDGKPILASKGSDLALIGASLLDKLGGFIPERSGYETVQIYAPRRDAKVSLGGNPFKIRMINVAGRINFNREVNAERIVAPLEFSREMLNYGEDISGVYVDVNDKYANDQVKEAIQTKLGDDFRVITNYEKNELIYKTSRTEKIMVIVILVFIFILAAFNLVASLTMLFVEKKDNLLTLSAMGARQKDIFRIFFFEGLLISGKGIVYGLILGYGICILQLKASLLTMPNSGGESFPIQLSFLDGLMIIGLVSVLSFVFSYFPVKILMNKFNSRAF